MAKHEDKHANGDHSSNEMIENIEAKTGYGEDRMEKVRNDIKDPENPNVHQHMNLNLFSSLVAMSFLWVGSQIPLYLFGSVLPLIYSEIGGAGGRYVWMVVGYLIPNAALCPFVGALSDMFGRRMVAATGQVLLIIGPIITSTAHSINVAIGGMVLAGLGAGLNELIALAGTAELVPVKKRGTYIGGIVITILPFCPSVLWAQLIARDSNWRFVGILVGIWNFIGLILVLTCYKDPARNAPARPAKEILREVDYIGGFLSTIGVLGFMMGMQWGAEQYAWTSAHVLAPFFIGVAFIIAFFIWEIFLAPYPMAPKKLFSKDKRTMILILFITFFSGANFFVLLLFWPTQVYNMYGSDPLGVGLRALPIGFGIIFGAAVALILIPIVKGRTTALMIFWCTLMTAFTGAMSVANTHNLSTVLPIILFASIGVGAVIIPCSIIAQIVCPTELIGTITAITLSIRYIGGAIGFTAYYNVFFHKFSEVAAKDVALAILEAGIAIDTPTITTLITLAGQARFAQLHEFIQSSPRVLSKPTAFDAIITATQDAFALAYRWPYWISIAFGSICLLLSFGLRDIRKFL